MRFAVVDLDNTLIEGSIAHRLVKKLLKRRGLYPKRYYVKIVKLLYLAALSPFKRFSRVYNHILRSVLDMYFSMLKDPRVDREGLTKTVREVVEEVDIHPMARRFLTALRARGYTIVLLSASPQDIVEMVNKKVGADIVFGSREEVYLTKDVKRKIIKELKKKGDVEIVVGNRGADPVEEASRYAILVSSPSDLRRWLPLLGH